MTNSAADRNLLFAVLALQLDFISRDALIRGMHAWVLEKHRRIGEILVEQKALPIERFNLLEVLVDEHLRNHDDNVQQSLAALPPQDSICSALEAIADSDLNATLEYVRQNGKSASLADMTSTVGLPTGVRHRFAVLRLHARGGLGEVFVARDEELNREVALKQISPERADDANSRARFVMEAEVTGSLEHPGIVPVYGLGHYGDGRPYYAMRFIRGESLRDAIASFHSSSQPIANRTSRNVEFRNLLGRFIDVCNAVAYAHSRGVLHRDLKPSNIMLGKYGETLVVDWGLAKVIGRGEDLAESDEATLQPLAGSGSAPTVMGVAVGTPVYMSPEQAAGLHDQLTPATDVYSLGATLYEMLTGRRPFSREDKEQVLQKVVQGRFMPPRHYAPTISSALESVCLKAMSNKPRDRYASARELAADVERWLADERVTVHKDSAVEACARWCRRHRSWALAGFGTLAAVSVASVIATLLVNEQRQLVSVERNAALRLSNENAQLAGKERTARTRADQLAANETSLRRQAQLDALNVKYDQALARCTHENAGRGCLALAEVLTKAVELEERDLEDSIRMQLGVWRQEINPLTQLMQHDEPVTRMALNPDGKTLALAQGKAVILRDTASKRIIGHRLEHNEQVGSVAFSPDGGKLVTGAQLWNVATGQRVGAAMIAAVIFTPDGERILGADTRRVRDWDSSTTHRLDLSAGLAGLTEAPSGKAIMSLAITVDGQTLITGHADGYARFWDADSGKAISQPLEHESGVNKLAVHPAGKLLLTGSASVARLWDLETGRMTGLPLRHRNVIVAVAFNSNGSAMAIAGGGTVQLWDVPTRRPLGPPLRHRENVYAGDISPDGAIVVTGSFDKTAQMWDANTGEKLRAPLQHDGDVWTVRFSRDGGRIATGSIDKTARIWDVASGDPIGTPLPHSDSVTHMTFTQNGNVLITGTRDGWIRFWDTANSQPVGTGHRSAGGVTSLALSPDGATLLTAASSSGAKLWRTETWGLLDEFLGKQSVRAAFSPITGKVLLADGMAAQFWDLPLRQWTGPSFKHEDNIRTVACASNERLIATASLDGTARIWETMTGRQVGPPLQHESTVWDVVFNTRSDAVLTASQDRTAVLWSVAAPMAGDPREIYLRIQGMTGLELDANGAFQNLTSATWQHCMDELRSYETQVTE